MHIAGPPLESGVQVLLAEFVARPVESDGSGGALLHVVVQMLHVVLQQTEQTTECWQRKRGTMTHNAAGERGRDAAEASVEWRTAVGHPST